MKKLFIALTTLVAALAISSCVKEESFGTEGEVVSTTISVDAAAATKASADADGAAAAVKRCIVQVLMGDKVYETKTIDGTAGQKSYTTSIDLINGQSYTIIAWVDAGADYYTFDEATANVTRVSAASAMDETLDAFYGSATLDLAATQNTQVKISAKRPLAQINLIATDEFKAGFEPTDLVVTCKAAETFNVLSGEFDGEVEYTATAPAAYTDNTLAMTYIFAEAERSVLDVTLSATFGDAYERTFTNIPVQQNYRTNISGKFFTVGSDITIDVDPIWDGGNDVFLGEITAVTPVDDVYTISTAAELNWFAQETISNPDVFYKKTIKLANNIDLCNYEWTPINASNLTFDGCGYTVKNVYVNNSDAKNVGLFGTATICTIKDLTVDGASVTGINHVAAISGDGLCAHFINCHVKNAVVTSLVKDNDDGDKAGAICGYLSGESDAEVTNCTAENCTINAYRDLGALVGYANGTATVTGNTASDCTVNCNCTNNYKNYTGTQFDANEIVGEANSAATVSDNTANNVTIHYLASNGEIAEVTPVDDVYTISTAAELNWFAQQVNTGANNFSGKTVELASDIDLADYDWTPVGNVKDYPTISFHGTFDGKNFSIKNLNAVDATPNYAAAGLFGSLCGAVKNLTIDGFTVKSSHYAGAIVAFDDDETGNTQVINCTVKNGTVTSTPELIGTEYDNGDKAGAVFGYIMSKAVVKDCTVENVTVNAYRDLGALGGYANGTASVTGNTVSNCTVNCIINPNYKNYTTSAAFDANELIGEASASAAVSGNTATGVTVNYVASASSAAELASAAANATVIELATGTYTLPDLANNVTINGADGVVIDATGAYGTSICSVPNGCTFNNVEFNFGANDYHGFQHAGTINMNRCKLNGKFFSYGDMNFTSCVFNQTEKDYNMWCYAGNLTYTSCSFTGKGKFLNVYNEGSDVSYNITATACSFTSTVANKAAFNVKETCGSTMLKYNVVINNCATEGEFPSASADKTGTLYVISPLVQVDDRDLSAASSDIHVTLNDVVVY